MTYAKSALFGRKMQSRPAEPPRPRSAQPTPLQPDGFRVIGYESDLQGGGVIAGVGQRLLDITSRFPIKKFFEKLTAEAAD